MSKQLQWNLPHTLLELTLAQSRQCPSPFAPHTMFRRRAHALAMKVKPDVRAGFLSPLLVPSREKRRRALDISKPARAPSAIKRHQPHPIATLSDRVEALVQGSQEADVATDELHYDDGDLQMLYSDVLAHSELEKQPQETEVPERTVADILQEAMDHITLDEAEPEMREVKTPQTSSLAAKLAARMTHIDDSKISLIVPTLDPQKTHHSIILRLRDVVQAMENAKKVAAVESVTSVPVLSYEEWVALMDLCVDEADFEAAEYALALYKRTGQIVPERLFNCVADAYAKAGNVNALKDFYKKFIETPTERQRDLHIKAHLKATPQNGDIHSALAVLHKYEALALLPPVQSYTRLICSLFSMKSAQYHAQAWDLFAHMRYVAHPKPDELLYALMIRACAGTGYSQSSYVAQPERAMDLWTELRQDMRHPPSIGTYDAIILACARTRSHSSDAFRLAREMLDSHRDAFGNPLMQPSRATFAALLWAAKMSGDLSRTRWILAEMLNLSEKERAATGATALSPDGKIMIHVFHAYAAYRPPFRRGSTRIVDAEEAEPMVAESEKTAIESLPLSAGRFGKAPPQTPAEVLAEVEALFQRVLDDTGRGRSSASVEGAPSVGAFSEVALSPVLVNSYLSVHYRHGDIGHLRNLFGEIFEEAGTERTPRSYVEALERCAYEESGPSRDVAYEFAEELWTSWLEVEPQLRTEGATARLIERARAAMIRTCALVGELDRAMSLLRDFASRYSCTAVATPAPKHPMRSARTQLFGGRPLVRMSAPSEVPDDTVPPVLTFTDLEILHNRLVTAGPSFSMDVSYLTFLCKAYEGALRTRRDRTLKT